MSGASLEGVAILVANDDYLLAKEACDWLRALGAEICGPVSSECDARRLLAARRVDGAVVKLDLRDGSSAELARRLGLGLSRVKRILGLLNLSGVIRADEETVRVLDWQRLSDAAAYDSTRLGRSGERETEEDLIVAAAPEQEDAVPQLTAAGDPACFV